MRRLSLKVKFFTTIADHWWLTWYKVAGCCLYTLQVCCLSALISWFSFVLLSLVWCRIRSWFSPSVSRTCNALGLQHVIFNLYKSVLLMFPPLIKTMISHVWLFMIISHVSTIVTCIRVHCSFCKLFSLWGWCWSFLDWTNSAYSLFIHFKHNIDETLIHNWMGENLIVD